MAPSGSWKSPQVPIDRHCSSPISQVQEQVRGLAEEIGREYERLDLLINNAGVYMPERVVAPGGIEMTFATNFVAPFLLTHDLLPLLSEGSRPGIVNVASIAHRSVRSVDWKNLPGFDTYDAYPVSKLEVVASTTRLAGMLEGTGVTANCLHPAVIDTRLLRAYIREADSAPPGRGVEVYIATSPDAATVNGGYFEATRWTGPSPPALDPAVGERFWAMGPDITGLREREHPRRKAYAG